MPTIDKQTIANLILECDWEKTIDVLSENIRQEPDNDHWRLMRGQVYWRLGEKSKAITDYEYAVQINPQSPARTPLELARKVMSYYNPDLMNP